MKSPDLSRPTAGHACPADFAIIVGRASPRECNLRGDAQRAFYRVAPIARGARCARIALGGALVVGRPTCILTGDCLRAHALRQAGIVGATLLSSSSRVCTCTDVYARATGAML